MVLTILHPGPGTLGGQHETLKVDIVAVHGLNGDPVDTWTNKKTGAYWLRDYLPAEIEGARVMTYGYNADVAFGNTVADIEDFAKDLLNSLIDKREQDDESRRPIIFIAHSLGGIVVKQALTAAHVNPRFQNVKERTIGIAFFGTPHRGSEKASYGKVLASVATTVMHRPSSKLISALQSNSAALERLDSDFRFQLNNYQILTFYETRPMSFFSKPIVEKHSALLQGSGEEQIMVDSNHREMCKFASKEDDIYDKLVKRMRRILAGKSSGQPNSSNLVTFSGHFNEYYEVPYNVSSVFTGRKDVLQKIHDNFFPRQEQALDRGQKRYVIHGLGGSGKTQICLKFAQDAREKFRGIFFIDASSASAAEQGLLAVSRKVAVEQSLEGIKRWLSNQKSPWLLMFDNADDPELDIARFFPTGGRGAILITTRNPECKIHATVGSSKLDQMELDEAVTLLLRASFVANPEDETSRNSAQNIVHTLGCLALAIVHAGATIRQGVCTLDDYCIEFSRHRKQLLDRRPIQAGAEYEHTVYSTWELSIERITKLSNETAKNAIELLNFFSVLHFEGISEKILEKAWKSARSYDTLAMKLSPTLLLPFITQDTSEQWNPQLFRQAIALLSSYSLIHIDGTENEISLHPLVHAWIRDRLAVADRSKCYIMSTATLATSLDITHNTEDISYIVNVQKHIDSCLRFCHSELWVEYEWSIDRILMAAHLGRTYRFNNGGKEARDFLERAVEYSKKTMNEECLPSLYCIHYLGESYFDLGERRKGIDLLQKAIAMARNTCGPEDVRTFFFMRSAVHYLLQDHRIQESIDLIEELRILQERILPDGGPEVSLSMFLYADALSQSGENQKAVELLEDAIATLEEPISSEYNRVLYGNCILSEVYRKLHRWQEAAELCQQMLESRIKIYGIGHIETLNSRVNLALSYEGLNRPQDAIQTLTETVNIARNTYGGEDPNTISFADYLKQMQARYDQSLANKATQSSSSSRWTLKNLVQRRQRS